VHHIIGRITTALQTLHVWKQCLPGVALTRNFLQYDTDCITWSPQGRIHQIQYACEAVKNGSACVGLRSNTHVVLAALKRSQSELASYQQKVFKIDDHVGIAISGLTADARVLSRYMRQECMNHSYVYEEPLPLSRLVTRLADKSQVGTQRSGKRPYGVGLLVAGHDETGPHLYQTEPSGVFHEFYAMAIGSRSQAARTYLERTYEAYPEASVDDLINHALLGLKESAPDNEINSRNISIGIVGPDAVFRPLNDEDVQPYIDRLQAAEEGGNATAEGEAMATE